MKIGTRLRTVAAAAAVSVTLVATGCGGGGGGTEASPGPAGSQAAENANLAITFVPKNLGNPYFDTSDKGGEEAIKEFGVSTRKSVPPRPAPTPR
jgi:rhamnose transport system substrate-binding protein